MSIKQLIYSSLATAPIPQPDILLAPILAASRRNNALADITGFLLFDEGTFVQILEGEREAVEGTFQRIRTDARHKDVMTIGTREIRRRSFPRWSMCSASRSDRHAAIFARHGFPEPLDQGRLLVPSVLALALDLQDAVP